MAVALSILVCAHAPAAAAPATEHEQRLVQLTGEARAANGVPAYSTEADLAEIGRRHAQRMAEDGELYHNPNILDEVQGWQAVGENIANGKSAEAIHEEWMASAEHRGRILSTQYTQVGIGVFVDDEGVLWVSQVFRKPVESGSTEDEYFEPDTPADSPPTTAAPPGPSVDPAPATAPPATSSAPARARVGARVDAPATPPPTTTTTTTTLEPEAEAEVAEPEAEVAAVTEETPPSALSVESVAYRTPDRRKATLAGLPVPVIAGAATALWLGGLCLVVVLRRRNG